MVFGNVGAGKSTLLNCMLGRYSKYLEPLHYEFYKKNKEKLKFEAKSNGESVTKEVKYSTIGRLCLIDVPGYSDSKKEENGLSDRNLNIMITEHLRRLLCPIYTKAFTDLHQ